MNSSSKTFKERFRKREPFVGAPFSHRGIIASPKKYLFTKNIKYVVNVGETSHNMLAEHRKKVMVVMYTESVDRHT